MAKQKGHNLSDFHLHAIGRWGRRGEVEIHYQDTLLGSLGLGPGPWSVLAVLMEAAIEAGNSHPLEACRTKDEIADTLAAYACLEHHANYVKGYPDDRLPRWLRNARLGLDPNYVKGYLHDLRAGLDVLLRSRLGASPDPGGWGFFLVPTHESLGYHMAVPPENLRLTILGRRPG